MLRLQHTQTNISPLSQMFSVYRACIRPSSLLFPQHQGWKVLQRSRRMVQAAASTRKGSVCAPRRSTAKLDAAAGNSMHASRKQHWYAQHGPPACACAVNKYVLQTCWPGSCSLTSCTQQDRLLLTRPRPAQIAVPDKLSDESASQVIPQKGLTVQLPSLRHKQSVASSDRTK